MEKTRSGGPRRAARCEVCGRSADDNLAPALGRFLKLLLFEWNVTPETLEANSGVHREWIVDILQGTKPSLETVLQLIEGFRKLPKPGLGKGVGLDPIDVYLLLSLWLFAVASGRARQRTIRGVK